MIKQFDGEGNQLFENHIITPNYDDDNIAIELPRYIRICDLKPGELPFMKRRSPQVLRYHKFNKEKNPHEYYFSELQLYHPHGLFSEQENSDLQREREDFERCKQTFWNKTLSSVNSRFLRSISPDISPKVSLK